MERTPGAVIPIFIYTLQWDACLSSASCGWGGLFHLFRWILYIFWHLCNYLSLILS
jgi:hypothetical protein